MKNYLVILLLMCFMRSFPQTAPPQAFSYSAVARNNSGNPLISQSIGLQFSILKGSTVGAVVYQENQFTTTNQFGLFELMLGTGTVQSGIFSTINWGNDNYYLKVGLDATGGTNFQLMGITQFLSVPYAMYAKSAGSVGGNGNGGGNGYTVKFNGVQISDSNINMAMLGVYDAFYCSFLTDSNYRFSLVCNNNTQLTPFSFYTTDTTNLSNLYVQTDVSSLGTLFSPKIFTQSPFPSNVYYLPNSALPVNVPSQMYVWNAYGNNNYWSYETILSGYTYYVPFQNNASVTGFNLTFPVHVTFQKQ